MTATLRRVWTHGDFEVMSRENVDALPPNTVRVFDLHGVYVPYAKLACGRWRPLARKVPGYVLASVPSAERLSLAEKRGGSHVAAMHRVAKAAAAP